MNFHYGTQKFEGIMWITFEELCVMTLHGDVKFKGKLNHGLKNDIRNLINFHASSQKSGHLHFDCLLLSKAYNVLDEKCKRVMSDDAEE